MITSTCTIYYHLYQVHLTLQVLQSWHCNELYRLRECHDDPTTLTSSNVDFVLERLFRIVWFPHRLIRIKRGLHCRFVIDDDFATIWCVWIYVLFKHAVISDLTSNWNNVNYRGITGRIECKPNGHQLCNVISSTSWTRIFSSIVRQFGAGEFTDLSSMMFFRHRICWIIKYRCM